MKKIISSLALASAVMVSLLSSCQMENIETTFEPNAAVATIKVTVLSGITGEDVTSLSTITANVGLLGANVQVSGSDVIITGNKDIVSMTVNVGATAVIEGVTMSTNPVPVAINPLQAGGKGSYSVTLIVGSSTHYYELVKTTQTSVEYAKFNPKNGHSIDHADFIWTVNDTEFLLKTKMPYKNMYGTMSLAETTYDPAAFDKDKKAVDFIAGLLGRNTVVEKDAFLDMQISAWSMYTGVVHHNYYLDEYEIDRVDLEALTLTKVGTVKVNRVSTNAYYWEVAMAGHEAQYHYGHGQEDIHGYSENAGGGILWD